MREGIRIVKNERGGGLLMALLVIVALAAIAAGIMSTVSTDRRITSYGMTRAQTLNYAEAGVAEALERIRSGDVPDNRNPKMVAQIFLANAGDVPSVGTDTTAIGTAQPAGQWLPYSSESKGPDVLTIQYMTDAARTGIYCYDATKSPPIQGKTGDPVFLIRSPARIGTNRRQIETAVSAITIQPNIKGALVGRKDLKLKGTDIMIGYDYNADTPAGTCNDGNNHATWQTNVNNVAAAWSTKKVDVGGSAKVLGQPNESENNVGFYTGPWDVIGMGQAEFYNWVGPAISTVKNGAPLPSGITYLSHKGDKPQKGKHDFKFKGGNADGLLYVNGDLEITGDFTFRGLIYVEGNVKLKGKGWVLGCVVTADHAGVNVSHHDILTVVKSNQAVTRYISERGKPFVTLTWREG